MSSSTAFDLAVGGTLTLDADNDPAAVFIFKMSDSSLTTGVNSEVVLINGAQACNVFWQVGSSAALGVNSDFVGNILALTSITAANGASIDGRLLARNAAVTLHANTITAPDCELATTTPTPTEAPETATATPTATEAPETATTTPTPTEAPETATATPTATEAPETATATPTSTATLAPALVTQVALATATEAAAATATQAAQATATQAAATATQAAQATATQAAVATATQAAQATATRASATVTPALDLKPPSAGDGGLVQSTDSKQLSAVSVTMALLLLGGIGVIALFRPWRGGA